MAGFIAWVRKMLGPFGAAKQPDTTIETHNPLTIRTQQIMRGYEDGIEKHSYRGNPEQDDKWPDQGLKS